MKLKLTMANSTEKTLPFSVSRPDLNTAAEIISGFSDDMKRAGGSYKDKGWVYTHKHYIQKEN